jgi:hypothetical protein
MTNEEASKFLTDGLSAIERLKVIAEIEAKSLFPDHPKAQDVWVRLCSGEGAIKEVAQVLDLQVDHDQYYKTFMSYLDSGNIEAAVITQESFIQFCKDQVKENFFMFK